MYVLFEGHGSDVQAALAEWTGHRTLKGLIEEYNFQFLVICYCSGCRKLVGRSACFPSRQSWCDCQLLYPSV